MAIIGIDLGTTNSLVGIWEENSVKLIPNRFGETLTPSIVSFDKDGQYFVGKIAKERLITHPAETFREFKRELGTSKVYKAFENKYSPEELSTFVLKQLKEDAEHYLGESVNEAIISVPAYFNDKQRAATRTAGLLAGLRVERLINEPSAAALAYKNNNEDQHQNFIVYDFGGGTLDVSLVDAFYNVIEIQAVSGDNILGGKDFNEIIYNDFCNKNKLVLNKMSAKNQAILYRESESIKIQLTSDNVVERTIRIENKEYKYSITNQELIDLSADLFRRMTIPLQRVINDSEIQPGMISKVILVGGSSKMPVVRHYINSLYSWETDQSINPDEIVAIGAAIVAGIKERKANIKDIVLSDICPFTLGIGVVGDMLSPIISKNQILPCSRQETYCTAIDYQENINIQIYQGEKMTASDNLLIDDIKLKLPPRPKGEVYVDVRFSYDINGLFEIDIQSPFLKEGIHKSIVSKNVKLSQDEIVRRSEELMKLKIHPRDMEENRYILEAAQRIYEQCNTEQQKIIIDADTAFKKVLSTQDMKKIKPAYVEFALKLKIIEQSLFHFSEFDVSFWDTVSENQGKERKSDKDSIDRDSFDDDHI